MELTMLLDEVAEFPAVASLDGFLPVLICPDCNIVMFTAATDLNPAWQGQMLTDGTTKEEAHYCPRCAREFKVTVREVQRVNGRHITVQTTTSWPGCVRVVAKPVQVPIGTESVWYLPWTWGRQKTVRKWEVRQQDLDKLLSPLEILADAGGRRG